MQLVSCSNTEKSNNHNTNHNIKEELLNYINETFFRPSGFLVTLDGLKFLEDKRTIMGKIAKKVNCQQDISVRKYFASSLQEICIQKINPILIEVGDSETVKMFKYATSFWSIPVTSGYGRRVRLIVYDNYNHKVIGIVGFCDPVIALKVRDDFIGWGPEVKNRKIYSMLTAYVLGAVPPYNEILGGKLVALLATSQEVTKIIESKYKTRRENFVLAAIDTFGAFGKSVIYNKLKGWHFVGYTRGLTHYHLTCNDFWEYAKEILKQHGKDDLLKLNRFGDGPNFKFRILKEVFQILGIQYNKIMNFGMKRGYYFHPFLTNWKEFLTGETDIPVKSVSSMEEQIEYWKKRWLKNRLKKFNLS